MLQAVCERTLQQHRNTPPSAVHRDFTVGPHKGGQDPIEVSEANGRNLWHASRLPNIATYRTTHRKRGET